jgi:3-oxoacyl-[acyl-carrier-protein] synthase II
MNNHNTTVAVTGLGLMTGLGVDLERSWQGLINGKSVAAPFRDVSLGDLACPFGVELPAEADELFNRMIRKRKRSQMTRSTQISLVTAQMALEDSALDLDRADRTRVGVVIGTTGTAYVPETGQDEKMRILKNMSNSSASWVSLTHKLHGPSFVVGTACSSGVYAMASAYGLIVSGQCDVVISGSVDSSINRPDIEGFCELMALADGSAVPARASRPFDRLRSGFVIGEGGGMVILESMQHARERNARIYGMMHYPGLWSEAYNILSPEPDGRGMVQSMQLALKHSGLGPHQIDYINAHGTSTNLNDYYETLAIKEVFGSAATQLPVSSTKSMTGHCLAGAGGVEAVIVCKSLVENLIPPTINLTHADTGLDLDYVASTARVKQLNHVMSNSFAFGGHNGVNIFSRYNP